jgi:hypothetical protein
MPLPTSSVRRMSPDDFIGGCGICLTRVYGPAEHSFFWAAEKLGGGNYYGSAPSLIVFLAELYEGCLADAEAGELQLHLYEQVPATAPCKLYFDVEWYTEVIQFEPHSFNIPTSNFVYSFAGAGRRGRCHAGGSIGWRHFGNVRDTNGTNRSGGD